MKLNQLSYSYWIWDWYSSS